jgi:hypothetical protein
MLIKAIRGSWGYKSNDLLQTFDLFPHDLLSVDEQGEIGTGSFSAVRKGACPIFSPWKQHWEPLKK